MKRFISILLALCMAAGLAAPALADGEIDTGVLVPGQDAPLIANVEDAAMDAALAELTAQVKQTLGVDDGYTNFYSDYNDSLTPRWSLNWSDEGRQLTAEVTPEGKILNVSHWADSAGKQDFFYGFDPAFPALSAQEAAGQAEDWYGKLFTGNESGRTQRSRMYLGAEGTHRFYGTVDLNGLPSPITFSLSVGGDGLDSFYRSDAYMGYVGIVPDPHPAVEEADAAKALADASALELYYMSDGEGGAVLRYVPAGPRMTVDAQTGEAVDMDALYASLGGTEGEYGVTMDAAAEAAEPEVTLDSGLTEAELSSIENYGDVMDQAALDQALRTLPAIGLDGFTAERCSYSMDGEGGDVTADLRYMGTMTAEQLYGFRQEEFDQAAAEGRDLTIYKYITVDAKTGALKGIRTNYPLWQRSEDDPGAEVQAELAVPFAEQAVPELAAQAEACTLTGFGEQDGVVLAQVHEGYFYPDNRIELHADPASGVVDQFSYTWDENVVFGPAEGLVGMEAALTAYADALDVTLGYTAWPLDLALEENALYAAYQMWGYTYVEELRLAYYYDGLEEVEAVDALTGDVVKTAETEGVYSYDDLDGVPQADMIAALGEAGVGFDGGAFLPEEPLTERDAVVLLLRAGGSHVSQKDDATLLDQAYYQGLLRERSWQPDDEMSGSAFLRMLLGASRYGDAAELLSGGDTDGYELIAAALGIAPSAPEDTLTRAAAAELLYGFMDR